MKTHDFCNEKGTKSSRFYKRKQVKISPEMSSNPSDQFVCPILINLSEFDKDLFSVKNIGWDKANQHIYDRP